MVSEVHFRASWGTCWRRQVHLWGLEIYGDSLILRQSTAGGIFLIIYIVLALTFGYTMIVAETAIGRMTRKSPVGAFKSFGKKKWLSFGGWINAVIPVLIVPYYSVIGGWVIKYLVEYFRGNAKQLAEDGYFTDFISMVCQRSCVSWHSVHLHLSLYLPVCRTE